MTTDLIPYTYSQKKSIQDEDDIIQLIVDFWAGLIESRKGEHQQFRASLYMLIETQQTLSGLLLSTGLPDGSENSCSPILAQASLEGSIDISTFPKGAICSWDSSTGTVSAKLPSTDWRTL